ncbi:MAG: hypothetical protein VB778_02195 [Nitrospinaceae bacterium]|jgi:hypothetical protein
MPIEEVEWYLQEMNSIKQGYEGDNITVFFRNQWTQHEEELYFILKSIELAGIRIVRDSSF